MGNDAWPNERLEVMWEGGVDCGARQVLQVDKHCVAVRVVALAWGGGAYIGALRRVQELID